MLYETLKKLLPSYNVRLKLKTAFMYFCRIFPIVPDKVVFVSYYGKSYNDNPRAIFKEMVKQRPNYKYVWLLRDDKKKIFHAKTVKFASFEELYHLATARIWIDNCRKSRFMVKRRGQYYVQTWHSNVGPKKVESDVVDSLTKGYVKDAINDSKMIDLMISGTSWNTNYYKNSFWYNGEILEQGYPYCDILYEDNSRYHKKVCKYFSLPETTHLCIYAPTFRVDENLDCYNLDFKRVLKALKEKWGGEWKILMRLHSNIAEKHSELRYTDDVLDASLYNEMNELAAASEVTISDYSSTMIYAMEAGNRALIYASDYAEYQKDRSLYFEKDELPFLFCESNDELIQGILNFNDEIYKEKTIDFMKRLGFVNDAHSTERVVKYILEKTEL